MTIEESCYRLCEAFGELANSIIAAFAPVLNSLLHMEDILSFEWAEKNHPEWVRMYCHAKKKRIRKKYADRIKREYRKWRNSRGKEN